MKRHQAIHEATRALHHASSVGGEPAALRGIGWALVALACGEGMTLEQRGGPGPTLEQLETEQQARRVAYSSGAPGFGAKMPEPREFGDRGACIADSAKCVELFGTVASVNLYGTDKSTRLVVIEVDTDSVEGFVPVIGSRVCATVMPTTSTGPSSPSAGG